MPSAKQSKEAAKAVGFDVDVPAPPKRTGLSPSEKGLLGLAMFAVLGAVGLVADVLAARDGQTPASGFDQFTASDDHASPAPADARASDAAEDPLHEGLGEDAQAATADTPRTTSGTPELSP